MLLVVPCTVWSEASVRRILEVEIDHQVHVEAPASFPPEGWFETARYARAHAFRAEGNKLSRTVAKPTFPSSIRPSMWTASGSTERFPTVFFYVQDIGTVRFLHTIEAHVMLNVSAGLLVHRSRRSLCSGASLATCSLVGLLYALSCIAFRWRCGLGHASALSFSRAALFRRAPCRRSNCLRTISFSLALAADFGWPVLR